MRLAQLLPLGVLAGWACTAAWAENSVPSVASVPPAAANAWLDPAATARPLIHRPLPPGGMVVDTPQDWRAANAAVAAFPRGHSDVVRWEAGQQAPAPRSAGAHKGHP